MQSTFVTSTESPPKYSEPAPERPFPSKYFYSVEYPGYVQPASVSRAIHNLGGISSLETAFKRTASKSDSFIELKLRPSNPFAHPVPGDIVATNNVLLKVVKRKRKRRQGLEDDGLIGEYTSEVVGVIPKTVRFRSMADYQYQPDINDPVTKLRLAMDKMDVDTILQYKFPEEKADYEIQLHSALSSRGNESSGMNTDPNPQLSNTLNTEAGTTEAGVKQNTLDGPTRSRLRMFPPPLFSRQLIPQNYNFKANSASMLSISVDEETGEEKKRLINRMRWKGYGPASILYTDSSAPEKPPQVVEDARNQADQSLLKRLQELFLERAIWTRASLFNQFPEAQSREIHNSKILLPLVCYVFQDGPWRDTLIKFGYDPRKDISARFYQRLYFRNLNHPTARPSVATRRQERAATNMQIRTAGQSPEYEADRLRSHIFDGQTMTKETAAFQLCDIVDPMLKAMIEDTNELRETCNERDGWYTTHALERIKVVLRHKFFSLLEGHIASDEECRELLESGDGSSKTKIPTTQTKKLKAGKHNMAKGALRPEDAAVVRLRATLEKNAKTFHSTR